MPWIGLIVVAVVALAIGTQRHGHDTIKQETTSIAGEVRCPVCSGETAAESDTPQSVEIRTYITQELQAGQSRSQILASLSSSYGPGILEKPSAKGINVLLWVLPGLAVILAVVGLGLVFSRWRIGRVDGVSDEDRRLVTGALDDPGDATSERGP
ncbi:MAG TPA: cytochrome c-type biogenesis protein CcmH [Acidimicrobiales bacterium]